MSLFVDISKQFTDFSLQASFDVDRRPLGILGASGSGKSMTLRCIAGLTTPDQGKIILNNRVLFDAEQKVNLPARRRKIGFLFQNYALFPHLTVEENIEFGIQSLSKKERKARVQEKLQMTQLQGMERRYPYQLSGGQQQRIALARALVTEPEALLLDEPFSALDNHLRHYMERELIEILKSYQGVVLFVTHNLEEAYHVCEQILVMDQGRIVGDGEREQIFLHPPTYMAAKLTGCKNLSKVSWDDAENVVIAEGWGGARLRVGQAYTAETKYIGLRAHHVAFVSGEELTDKENVFACKVQRIEEGPHRVTVYIAIGETEGQPLQVEVYKEQWREIEQWEQRYIWLDPEKLFLCKE